MASNKITLDGNGIPNRVATGAGKGTIPFNHGDYYGDPEGFKWTSSAIADQYQILKQAFKRNGLNQVVVGAERVFDHGRCLKLNKMGFVLLAGTDHRAKVIWQKYESVADGSGQNHVYINGQKIKMSSFTAMSNDQQDELIEPCILRRTLRIQGLA